MNTAPSGIARRWEPSGFLAFAAGITAICSVLGCSPVVSREGVPTAKSTLPESPACDEECLLTQVCEEGACTDQLTDCSEGGDCQDPTCTEPHRYSVDDEIAADLTHGRRLWQRGDAAGLDHAHAEAHCASLDLGGLTGWRLPDGAESGSIVFRAGGLKGCGAPGSCAPAIDQAVFPDTQADLYWTSQPYTDGMHFSRSFCDGRSTPYVDDDTALHDVRCVHDPLPL